MNTYLITSKASVDMGIFEGLTPQDAVDQMNAEAKGESVLDDWDIQEVPREIYLTMSQIERAWSSDRVGDWGYPEASRDHDSEMRFVLDLGEQGWRWEIQEEAGWWNSMVIDKEIYGPDDMRAIFKAWREV